MSAPHGAPAPVETDRQGEQAEQARPSAVRRLGLQRYAILIVFAAMVAAFGADIPATFLSIGNLSNILGGQAVLFILVMAVILPTIMGDFVDLSLGSSLGLSAMTLAVLNVQHGTNVVVACLAGIGAALVVGLVNVFFVVYFDNDPFIVTLGVMTIVQGIIYIISGNNSVGIVSTNLSDWVFNNDFLSIPLEFYYGLAIFLVVWYVLSYTRGGHRRHRGDRVRGHQRDGRPAGRQHADPPGLRGGLPRGDPDQAGPHQRPRRPDRGLLPGHRHRRAPAARHAELLPADLLRRRPSRGGHDPEGDPRPLLQEEAGRLR